MEWVVIENTPGYMPDVEGAEFEDYTSAVAYANELADELEADGYITDHIGSDERWYEITTDHPLRKYDLGRVITVERMEN